MQRWQTILYCLPHYLLILPPSLIARIGERRCHLNNDFHIQAWWGAKLVLDWAVILWNKIISINSLLEVTSFYNQRADCLSECIGCYTVWVSRVIFLSEENLGPCTWRAIWRHSKITFAQNFRLLTPYMLD